MGPSLQFPDANTIEKTLSEQYFFKEEYNVDKGISQTVIKLAKARFADKAKSESEISAEVLVLIRDLKQGVDSRTGEVIKQFDLNRESWTAMSFSIEDAIMSCAQKI